MIVFITYLAVAFMAKLVKLLSLIGALAATPLAMTIPILVHYKLTAKTFSEKLVDILVIMISACIVVFSVK